MKNAAEKLDYLMKLTGLQNAALGRAVSYDASYISRIRSGKRSLPSGQGFLDRTAALLASRIREDYQKEAVAGQLGLDGPWPEEKEAAALLADWLAGESFRDPVERMIAAFAAGPGRLQASEDPYDASSGLRTEAALFFGNAGKRDGVTAFLRALCRSGKAHRLLLFSDEDMSWLYEDPAFARSWAELMKELIAVGSRICIVHSVGRDSNEMWEAVRKWMPLYLSGAIEPWYYPRLRDGIYHRTLFVAEGHSALVADSVRDQQGDTLSLLLREPAAVDALTREFEAYLALCRPLMEIAHPAGKAALADILRAFRVRPGQLQAGRLLGALVCVKEDSCALVVKTAAPFVVFSIMEPRMVAAMGEYLRSLPEGGDPASVLEEVQALMGE